MYALEHYLFLTVFQASSLVSLLILSLSDCVPVCVHHPYRYFIRRVTGRRGILLLLCHCCWSFCLGLGTP
jgi:hypothetical protein